MRPHPDDGCGEARGERLLGALFTVQGDRPEWENRGAAWVALRWWPGRVKWERHQYT